MKHLQRLVRACIAVASIALLQACGGSGDDVQTPAATVTVTTSGTSTILSLPTTSIPRLYYSYPISHFLPSAATYTFTLTGKYTATDVDAGAGKVNMYFSFGGLGQLLSGNAYPTYPVTTAGQVVTISQTIRLSTSGPGPWLMQILCATEATSGTLSELVLTVTPS